MTIMTMTTPMTEKAYKTQLLVPEVHGRLVADIQNVARQANIPVQMIWTSAKEHCTDAEVQFLSKLPQHADSGVLGLVYVGRKPESPVALRMMALAGACLRNFINAKVMTVQEVLARLKEHNMPQPTVLLIPNFFIGKEHGGAIPAWQVAGLWGLLLDRQTTGLQTFVYVEDMDAMAAQYGDTFKDHFVNYFERIIA